MTLVSLSRAVVALLALFVVVSATPAASVPNPPVADTGEPTPLNGCSTITEPGRYVLVENVTDGGDGENFTYASEACIRVQSSDVHIEGDDSHVDGMAISDTTAVAVSSPNGSTLENVTVTNLTVTDWNRGVEVRNASDVTLRDVNASGNAYGVTADGVRPLRLDGVRAEGNLVGVAIAESRLDRQNVSIEDNHAADVVRT